MINTLQAIIMVLITLTLMMLLPVGLGIDWPRPVTKHQEGHQEGKVCSRYCSRCTKALEVEVGLQEPKGGVSDPYAIPGAPMFPSGDLSAPAPGGAMYPPQPPSGPSGRSLGLSGCYQVYTPGRARGARGAIRTSTGTRSSFALTEAGCMRTASLEKEIN